MRIALIGIALTASLAGCATSPISASQASPGRTVANEFQQPGADTGKFVVTRDSGMMGQACSQRVFVDGSPIADLRSGQTAFAYLPAGEHVAGVRANGICGGGSASTQVMMTAGKTKYFRVASGQEGDIKIEPSAF